MILSANPAMDAMKVTGVVPDALHARPLSFLSRLRPSKLTLSRSICSTVHVYTYFLCTKAIFETVPFILETLPDRSPHWLYGITISASVASVAVLWGALYSDPGVPLRLSKDEWRVKMSLGAADSVPWCTTCDSAKGARVHHCSTCNTVRTPTTSSSCADPLFCAVCHKS